MPSGIPPALESKNSKPIIDKDFNPTIDNERKLLEGL